MENFKIKRNDIVLLAGVLLIGIILFFVVANLKSDGAQVQVLVDGKIVDTYSIEGNKDIDLDYNGHNALSVSDGVVSVTNADCPDKLCVKQRHISRTGETIVCLPHKLVIRIEGGEASDIDGVIQ